MSLIGCCKQKLARPAPARELYCSPYFRLCAAYVQKRKSMSQVAWCILSAKHGVVMPDDVIEPYDLSLSEMSAHARQEWADRTRSQIVDRWGERAIYRAVMGSDYCSALRGLPMVHDVFAEWTRMRRESGMRKPQMGIGVLKRRLREEIDEVAR